MTPTEPQGDGGYGWVIVLSSFTATFLVDGILFSFGLVLNVLVDEFKETTVSVSIMGAMLLGCIALSSPVAGSLSDTYGRRYVTIVGAVMSSLGFFVSTFASNVRMLYFTYGIVGGLGFGLMFTPPFASVMEKFKTRRGIAEGVALSGAGAGMFAMNLCTNKLLEVYGWKGTFLVLSGMMLNGVACGLVLPQTKTDSDQNRTQACSEPDSASCICIHLQRLKQIILKLFWKDNIAIFRDFQALSYLLSAFSFGLAYYIPFSLLPRQAIALGFEQQEIAWLTSTIGITDTVSRIVVGWLGHRSFINRSMMLKCILFLIALLFITSLLLTTFQTKLIFAALYGTLFGSYYCTVPLALADAVGVENSGKIMGLLVSMIAGANFIGTPLAAWTVDVTGDFVVCFSLAGK